MIMDKKWGECPNLRNDEVIGLHVVVVPRCLETAKDTHLSGRLGMQEFRAKAPRREAGNGLREEERDRRTRRWLGHCAYPPQARWPLCRRRRDRRAKTEGGRCC